MTTMTETIHPELELLCRQIEQRIGLVFHPHQIDNLIDTARVAAANFGYADTDALARALPDLRDGAPVLDYLISRLTVGESFFFRDAAQMDWLRLHYLPALIEQRRNGNRTLRVWSAATASGQELYSIAMLLRELLPDLERWNLHLVGTDLNARSLQSAVEGYYPEWSMRAVDRVTRERYFLPVAETGGGARIRPELRRMVRFALLNLAGDGFPSLEADLHSFDLVLCRNVFIYFEQQRVREVLARVARCMQPDGVLMLGASDVVDAHIAGFEIVQQEGLCFYRRGRSAESSTAAVDEGLDPFELPIDAQRCRRLAAAYGDLGRAEEALHWCSRAVELDPTDSASHFLQAMLQIEAGNDEAALEALRRTLFLAPQDLSAQHQMALLYLRLGQRESGLRRLRHVFEQAQQTGADAQLIQAIQDELLIHGASQNSAAG